MKRLKELREQRGTLNAELKTLRDTIEKESRAMTEGETTRFAEIDSELDKIGKEIETLEKLEARNREIVPVVHNAGSGEQREISKAREEFSFRKIMDAALSKRALDGLEGEMNQEAQRELRDSGVVVNPAALNVPSFIFHSGMTQKRTQSVTGGSNGSEGGVNVATNVGGIIDALSPYMVLAGLGVKRFDNLVGNLQLPRVTSTPAAAWETETGDANDLSATFGKVSLSPKRLAGYIPVTNQLMAQSSNDVENYIREYLLTGMAVTLEAAAIKGGGSNEPTGLIADSNVTVTYAGGATSNGTNAQGAAQVWADWVNLVKAVMGNNGTLLNPSFLTNPTVMGHAMQKSKQTNGVEGNFILNETMRALGYNVSITSNVPATLTKGTSSDLSAIIFGDWSKLVLASWGGMSVLVDPYSSSLAGTTNIVLNSYVDVGVLSPKSFAVCKDVDATTP